MRRGLPAWILGAPASKRRNIGRRRNGGAAQGNVEAAKNRDYVAVKMTPAQIAKVQKLTREWKPKTGRKPTGPSRSAWGALPDTNGPLCDGAAGQGGWVETCTTELYAIACASDQRGRSSCKTDCGNQDTKRRTRSRDCPVPCRPMT